MHLRSHTQLLNIDVRFKVDSLIPNHISARGCRSGKHRRRTFTVKTDVGSSDNDQSSAHQPIRIPVIIGRRRRDADNRKNNTCVENNRFLVRPHLQRHDCQKTKQLVGATHNIRSLGKSIEAIKQLAKDEQIGLLCFTETHLESDPVDLRRLRTDGFQVLERARPPKAGVNTDTTSYRNFGGVAIVASPTIRLTKLNTGNPRSFEHLCSRVTSNGSSCVVLLIYRPGSQPVSSIFFDELSAMLEALATSSDPLIVTGDVNIRLDRSDDLTASGSTSLLDLLASITVSLSQHTTVAAFSMFFLPGLICLHQRLLLLTLAYPTISLSSGLLIYVLNHRPTPLPLDALGVI